LIRLAILWHHHQPCYVDLRAGEAAMPWVRLHGTKDYWGMAALLREFPGVRAHVNLVPGLILQIEAAAAGLADPWLRLAQAPAAALSPEQKKALVETFFMAQEQHMVRAHPRYAQLLDLARRTGQPRPDALCEADFRDLQVWHNLCWFHPLLREENSCAAALVKKGRGFTEGEKLALLAAQREVLAGLIPAHRALQDRGQIEITTTPFWHPILPLLCRMESAHVAMPGATLPRGPGLDMADDARAQLERAVQLHQDRFGRPPRGLWPSEGSVSPEMAALAEGAGFSWMATDEGVLESSIGGNFARDRGVPVDAPSLYRPWRAGARLAAVFRDRAISDLVGFDYKHAQPEAAAADLVARVRASGRAGGDGALVTLALDGENAWEHYPKNGVTFLRALYRELEADAEIRTVLLGDELAARPPERAIPRLWSGSWIHRNFAIWVGHPEDNAAWEHLGRARARLLEATRAAGRDPRLGNPPAALAPDARPALDRAWESMLAAEGSDWTWWYGDQHFSPIASIFDSLFRTHVSNVWRFLGEEPPADLSRPIKNAPAAALPWRPPWALLDVAIDGRRSDYFEWISAGRYAAASDATVMDRSGAWIREVWFGFDERHLLIRVDVAGRAIDGLKSRSVHVTFTSPAGARLAVGPDGSADGLGARSAAGEILEIAVPLASVDPGPGAPLEFHVEAVSGAAVQRVPADRPISIVPPQESGDRVAWMA
jgi:alpha-amylase/alpha-mannosidase (GH57 family)